MPIHRLGADVTFPLTSPRGSNPTFLPDEPLEAMFRLSENGWLYCFYTASDGETTQLLPNKFQTRVDGHFYEGGKLHLFPDKDRRKRSADPLLPFLSLLCESCSRVH